MNYIVKLGILFCLSIAGITCASHQSFAATPHDGEYYYNVMKDSMLEVLADNQALINTNPDGSVKNNKLTPENYFDNSMRELKRLKISRSIKAEDLKGETNPEVIAPFLASMLSAGRINTAKSQQIINSESDGSTKLKKFIPAVFGRLVLEKFTEKSGAYMKQTTLGKGEYKARNPYNEPNEWEAAALKKIMTPGWPDDKGFGEAVSNEYHYVKPIYIKKACLPCHSVPVGEEGPYGHPKEGYKLGEIRGGISVSLPTK